MLRNGTSSPTESLLRRASWTLLEAGIPDARREAEILLGRVLKCDRLALYRGSADQVDSTDRELFWDRVERRSGREPLQYILGAQEFWALEFRVGPGVFIPRPETEVLVETAISLFPEPDAPLTICDVGTGSGCIGISLGREFLKARILATDCSAQALETACLNASRHRIAGRIKFLEGDLLEPLRSMGLRRGIDLVLSNPPYVRRDEIASLQPEIRRYEPRVALDGGVDGLDYYRRLLPGALDFIKPGGRLGLEVGLGQADPVCAMAKGSGWRIDRIMNDLNQIPRVIFLIPDRIPDHG